MAKHTTLPAETKAALSEVLLRALERDETLTTLSLDEQRAAIAFMRGAVWERLHHHWRNGLNYRLQKALAHVGK